MWTPKRVLILLGTLTFFVIGFAVYSFFLGNIDGLPPFPEDYLPGGRGDDVVVDLPTNERKLALAFGNECEELRRPIILDLNSKGFVLAAHQVDIEKEGGRIKLTPFSAALFPKNRPDAKFPEINIVQCEVAYLTLDRAVTSLTELNNRRVVGVELQSKGSREIVLINNRSTPEKHDDLEIRITQASLFYDETRNLITTDGYVKLQDSQSQPHPTTISAKGMDLRLTKDAARRKEPHKKGENIHGVETLLLKANVVMHFYVDGKAGFLGGLPETKSKPAVEAAPVERSRVVIQTPGKFLYDLTREMAWFDSPDFNPKALPAAPDQVTVLREHKIVVGGEKIDKFDQLVCTHLELQFRRKKRDLLSPRDQKGIDKEIETALATGRPEDPATGRGESLVHLTMESEALAAWGSELHYRCPAGTTGPQTTLKGSPLTASKDGHKIQCRELHLVGADKKGIGQQAFAKGPGQIDLYDSKKESYPFHAFWKDTLISSKDKDGDKVYDLLTLTGDAVFLDEEHKQQLQGQRLQVWLDQNGKAPGKVSGKSVGKQRPHKLDASERVSMSSQELIVERSNRLIVFFQNDDAPEPRLPEVLPDAKPALGGPAPVAPPAAEKAAKRKPVFLSANEIAAYVASKGAKKELMEVICEGGVIVRQEGDNPPDKGVEITGEMLKLTRNPRGDILYVFGDAKKRAHLRLGELVLEGPTVTINQQTNIAEVEGMGLMHMPSNKGFDGGRPTKPGTRLTVHWNKEMIFNGKDADFTGGVIAYQDQAAMKCDALQVTLDRVVSLKDGQKKGQQPAVDKLICQRKVYIEDVTKDPAGRLLQYNRLVCALVSVDNQEGPSIAHGPQGRVIHMGLGSLEDFGAKPAAGPTKAKALVMKRTVVDYEGQMFSNNKAAGRNAVFRDNVEVYHEVTDNPDKPVNADKPGKDGFYLRCDLLTVFTRTDGGKSSQEMNAKGKVFFRTDEFFGRADTITYNQASEQISFEGNAGNPATLWKVVAPGRDPQEIKGNKILYNRRTGEFHLEGGRVLRWSMTTPSRTPLSLCMLTQAALALTRGGQPLHPNARSQNWGDPPVPDPTRHEPCRVAPTT